MSLAQLHLQGCSSLIIRQLLAGILDDRVPTVTEQLPRISFINDKTINPLPSLNYECKCVCAALIHFRDPNTSLSSYFTYENLLYLRNVRIIRLHIYHTKQYLKQKIKGNAFIEQVIIVARSTVNFIKRSSMYSYCYVLIYISLVSLNDNNPVAITTRIFCL